MCWKKLKELSKSCHDASLFYLKLVVVFIFLYSGALKAFNPASAVQAFQGFGFPGFLGPIVGWVEVIASLLVLFNRYERLGGYALSAIIIVAILGVQLPGAFAAGKLTAGLGRDLLLLGAIPLVSMKPSSEGKAEGKAATASSKKRGKPKTKKRGRPRKA